jgi:hypothetical protein
MPGALPHVKSTRLRALGVSSLARAQALPDTPTIAESGLPGYDYVAWFGVFVPGTTPRAMVARIDALTKRALADAELKSKLELAGVTIQTSTPAQFQDLLKSEIVRWQKIIAAAGIKQILMLYLRMGIMVSLAALSVTPARAVPSVWSLPRSHCAMGTPWCWAISRICR